MAKKAATFNWIDWLLLLAIAVLSGVLLVMLVPPALEAWKNRPRPGVQVPQRCVVGQGYVHYLLYLPPGYHATTRWPLVVYLHGAGERGQDVNIVRRGGIPRRIDDGEKFEFIAVSPQCLSDARWEPETVVALIERISGSFSVDPDRVCLTGFSMGGYGTWQTACYRPEMFAAIAPLAGGGDVEQANRLTGLPIWAFHGAKDQVVPFAASKDMVEAVRKAGGQVEFTVLAEQDHGICEMVYKDRRLYEWLLLKRRNQGQAGKPR